MERVVITGMGAITPLGQDTASLWQGLIRGQSGISAIDAFDASSCKVRIAGQVRDFDAEARFGRKEARRMDRFTQFALAAAEEAYRQAELDRWSGLDSERMGVYVGSGIGGIQTMLQQEAVLRERGADRVSPTLVPMMIANMAAAQISIRYGAHGPSMAPVTACSIGNTAIGKRSASFERAARMSSWPAEPRRPSRTWRWPASATRRPCRRAMTSRNGRAAPSIGGGTDS